MMIGATTSDTSSSPMGELESMMVLVNKNLEFDETTTVTWSDETVETNDTARLATESVLQAKFAEHTAVEMKEIVDYYKQATTTTRRSSSPSFTKPRMTMALPPKPSNARASPLPSQSTRDDLVSNSLFHSTGDADEAEPQILPAKPETSDAATVATTDEQSCSTASSTKSTASAEEASVQKSLVDDACSQSRYMADVIANLNGSNTDDMPMPSRKLEPRVIRSPASSVSSKGRRQRSYHDRLLEPIAELFQSIIMAAACVIRALNQQIGTEATAVLTLALSVLLLLGIKLIEQKLTATIHAVLSIFLFRSGSNATSSFHTEL